MQKPLTSFTNKLNPKSPQSYENGVNNSENKIKSLVKLQKKKKGISLKKNNHKHFE